MGGLHYESLADLPPRMRQQVEGKVWAAVKADPAAGGEEKKPSKYRNVKTVVNGICFDSKKEANRYLALLDAVKAGVIYDLRLQEEFTLQEAYTTPEGERIRAIRYRADFTYHVAVFCYEMPCCVSFDDLDYWRTLAKGTKIIEDTKSRATKTKEYAIKRKLMAAQGHIIREV